MALRLWPTCYSVFNVHALLQGGGGRLTGSVCFSPMWGADRVPFNNLPCDHFLKVAKSGDEGIRTPDLRRAKAALSQLSYIPGIGEVGLSGLEPETSPLSEARSNQLS